MAIDALLDSVSAFLSQYPLLKTMSGAVVALAAVFLVILFFEARAGGEWAPNGGSMRDGTRCAGPPVEGSSFPSIGG